MFKKKFFFLLFLISFFSFFYFKIFQFTVYPSKPCPEEPCILYSNQCQSDLRWTIIKAVQEAQQSIHLMIFSLNDPSLIHLLKERSKKIPIHIYYDQKATKIKEKKWENIVLHPIKKSGFYHQKILVIDEKWVFLGSTNFTKKSFVMDDNLLIGLYQESLAKQLIQKAPFLSGHFHFFLKRQDVDLWFLPDPRGGALNEMLKNLRNARDSIKIAIFTFTHPSFFEELLQAKKRGVDIKIVTDKNSHIGPSGKMLKQLKKAGILIKKGQNNKLLHHKFIYVDNKKLLTGSANFTKSAFYKNYDNFLIFQALTTGQKKFIDRLWDIIFQESKEW